MLDQLVTLADQLMTGVDSNKDGSISWEEGEGGLQQAQEQMAQLKKGESN
jgi:hypothetical protein